MPHDVAEMARTSRRPTSLPSPDGSCRLITHSIRERIAEFRLF